jgi:NarL family two-component system response regulator LiaR
MTKSGPIRVVIVDDHAVVRSGLKFFFMASDEFELVGEAADGEQAVQLCAQVRPDVVLMDLLMQGYSGIDATRAIRKCCPQVQIIALTSFEESELVQGALAAGAIGYLLKNVSADELTDAIRAAYAGRPTLAPEAAQALIRVATHHQPPGHDLTPREREVLALMVEGLNNPEIARRLVVSLSTVKFHVSGILSKLGASSRSEAVALAVQHHLAGRSGKDLVT